MIPLVILAIEDDYDREFMTNLLNGSVLKVFLRHNTDKYIKKTSQDDFEEQ